MLVVNEADLRVAVADRLSRSESGARGGRRSLEEAVGHLRAGGKAVRARCARMVCAAFCPREAPTAEMEAFAEAVELLHLGSLIHDDVLDEAGSRRALPSVHVAFGTKVAVLAGDVAVSRSASLIARLDRPALSHKFAQVLEELCEGELLQDDHRWNPDVSLAAYLDRIAKKTGGLFELACEGAATLAGARPEQIDRAARFGRELGCLFQVVDDLLDGAEAAGDLGKPAGQDLANGVLTLRMVLALEDSRLGPLLRRHIRNRGGPLPEPLARGLAAPDMLARARATVSDLGALTREALDHLPAGAARSELAGLVDALCRKGVDTLAAGGSGDC